MPFLKTGNRIAVEGAEVNRLKKVFCFLAILFVPWMATSPLRTFGADSGETLRQGVPVPVAIETSILRLPSPMAFSISALASLW